MQISVNGVVIPGEAIAAEARAHSDSPHPEEQAGRALVIRELLLQRARELGLLPGTGEVSFADTAAEDDLIDDLLALEVRTPEPGEAECRRYFGQHPESFVGGELIEACHILFAVTPGAPVQAVRAKAAETLKALQAHPERFADLAKELSNCPSGQQGGNLGQLQRGQSVREFDAALFGTQQTGLLSDLVSTRFGFHIVRIDRRIAGKPLPFEYVHDRIAEYLRGRVRAVAFGQYLRVLAGKAQIEGIELDAASSPLVQ